MELVPELVEASLGMDGLVYAKVGVVGVPLTRTFWDTVVGI